MVHPSGGLGQSSPPAIAEGRTVFRPRLQGAPPTPTLPIHGKIPSPHLYEAAGNGVHVFQHRLDSAPKDLGIAARYSPYDVTDCVRNVL